MILRKQNLVILFFSLISIGYLNGAAAPAKVKYRIPADPASRSSQLFRAPGTEKIKRRESKEYRIKDNARQTNQKKESSEDLVKACADARQKMTASGHAYSSSFLTGSIPPEFKPLLDWLIKNSRKPKNDIFNAMLMPKVGGRAINIIWDYREGRYLNPQFQEALRGNGDWQTILVRNPWILPVFFQHGFNPNANSSPIGRLTYAYIAATNGFGDVAIQEGADLDDNAFEAGPTCMKLSQVIYKSARKARKPRSMPVPSKKS